MKVLSITPTNKCFENINRCEYCYLKEKGDDIPFEELYLKMIELIKTNTPEYVTFAYNFGYSLLNFEKLLREAKKSSKVSITIRYDIADTLNVEILRYIDYVTLSFNTDNYKNFSIQDIVNNLLSKSENIKIGINFLMNSIPQLNDILRFFSINQRLFDQFHFLIPKNYEIEYNLNDLIKKIKICKMMLPNKVFIDECLKTIITGENCMRDSNLLSLNANGTITKCSFASIDDNEKIIEKCPYLKLKEKVV